MKTTLTDSQVAEFRRKVENSFPWIARKNTLYKVRLVSRWEIEVREDNKVVAEILQQVKTN